MIDATILRQHGRYTVLAEKQPLRLRDGTLLDLHLVQEHGHAPARFLRAVLNHPLIESHIVDVRDLASCLDAEIRQLPERDSTDLVVLTLRQFYPDGASLLTRIVEESMCKLPPADTAAAPPTPSNDRGAWTCSACGFRGFWYGGAHCLGLQEPTAAAEIRKHGRTQRQRRHATEAAHAAA